MQGAAPIPESCVGKPLATVVRVVPCEHRNASAARLFAERIFCPVLSCPAVAAREWSGEVWARKTRLRTPGCRNCRSSGLRHARSMRALATVCRKRRGIPEQRVPEQKHQRLRSREGGRRASRPDCRHHPRGVPASRPWFTAKGDVTTRVLHQGMSRGNGRGARACSTGISCTWLRDHCLRSFPVPVQLRSVFGRSDRINAVPGRFPRDRFQCGDPRLCGPAASLAEPGSGRYEQHAHDHDDHHNAGLADFPGSFDTCAHPEDHQFQRVFALRHGTRDARNTMPVRPPFNFRGCPGCDTAHEASAFRTGARAGVCPRRLRSDDGQQ